MNKPKLKIDWATHEAAKFACEKWHYSRTIPKSKLVKIGVWEDSNFIGALIFSYGATADLVTPYGLKMNEGCELTRVALTKHVAPVSRIMAIALRLLKKSNPGLQIVVSFADANEGHHGGIYQATNWIYTGKTVGCWFFRDKKGKVWHPRNVSENLSLSGKCVRPSDCEKVWKEGKHRYLMPLNSEVAERIKNLARPYPKRVQSVESDTATFQVEEGGANPT